jgi:hypothetical protein
MLVIIYFRALNIAQLTSEEVSHAFFLIQVYMDSDFSLSCMEAVMLRVPV